MGTVLFPCGCMISSSMFGAYEIMHVLVCFAHSLVDEVHLARKELSKITDGIEMPENYGDPEVQEKLVALANAVRIAVGE